MDKKIKRTAEFFSVLRAELGEQDSTFDTVVKLMKAYKEQK